MRNHFSNHATQPETKWLPAVHSALIVLFGSFMLWCAWTGFTASDDSYYVQSGMGWLHDFPYVGAHIGTVRSPTSIPIAITMALLGENEFAAVLPSNVYFLGTLLITYWGLAKWFGANFSFIATLAIATIPLFPLKATIPSTDLPELFFSAAAWWLFVGSCSKENGRWARLLLAGACAAVAFMAHETAAALLMFFGLSFLLGMVIPRREYFIMAAGFCLMMLVEITYYGMLTGDPLYRFHLTLNAVSGEGDRVSVPPFHLDDGGTLHVSVWIDPLIMVLTKQEFCLFYYFAIAAIAWAWRTDWRSLRVGFRFDNSAKSLAWMAVLAGLVWFVFSVIALHKLKLIPRYYMMPTYFFALATALWAKEIIFVRNPRMAAGVLSAAILINFIGIAVDNKNPLFAERALMSYLAESTGTIYVDPYTAFRSQDLCAWSHQDCSRIVAIPPPANGVYFFNPKDATRANRFVKSPEEVARYVPKSEWKPIWNYHQPRNVIGKLVVVAGLKRVLPDRLYTKLVEPNPGVTVYQVPAAG